MKLSGKSIGQSGFVCGIVLLTVLSVYPQPAPLPGEGIDKIEHALAYFMVGGVAILGYQHRFSPAWIACALAVYGGIMEGVQYFLPSRFAEVWDIVANIVGVVVALIAVNGLTRLSVSRKIRNKTID